MVGGTISGYWATGKMYRHTAPMMTVMSAMTLAKMGWSMKNAEIIALALQGAGACRLHAAA
jgi:hypothetical protein